MAAWLLACTSWTLAATKETASFQPTSLADNDWTNPAVWSTLDYPQNREDTVYRAVVTAGDWDDYIQLNIHEDITIDELTLGDVLFLHDNRRLVVRDEVRWLGGRLSGNGGRYELHGPVWFEGPTVKHLEYRSELILSGASYWTGGHLWFSSYSKLYNEPTAVFHILTGGILGDNISTAAVEFYNRGSLIVAAPGDHCLFAAPLDNQGRVHLSAGTLSLADSFHSSGELVVAEEGTLVLWRETVFDTSHIENQGRIVCYSGPVFHQAVDLGGSVEFFAGFSGAGDMTMRSVTWSGGNLIGPGAILIPNAEAPTFRAVGVMLDRQIDNHGTLRIQTGAVIHAGANGGMWHRAGAMVLIEDGAQIGGAATPWTHDGLLRKTGLVGTATILSPLLGDGTVEVPSGRLELNGGVQGNPTLRIQPHATLRIAGSGFDLGTSSHISGEGTLEFGGAGWLASAVDTNLAVALLHNALGLDDAINHQFRRMRMEFSYLTGPGEADILESLELLQSRFHGQVHLRSHGSASFRGRPGFAPMELLVGEAARVSTLGRSDLERVDVRLHDTAAWRNAGEMVLEEHVAFLREPETRFDNAGTIRVVGSDAIIVLPLSSHTGRLQLDGGMTRLSLQEPATGQIEVAPTARLDVAGSSLDATARIDNAGRIRLIGWSNSMAGSYYGSGVLILEQTTLATSRTAELWAGDLFAALSTITLADHAARIETCYLEQSVLHLNGTSLSFGSGLVARGSRLTGTGVMGGTARLESSRLEPGGRTGTLRIDGPLTLADQNSILSFALSPARTQPALRLSQGQVLSAELQLSVDLAEAGGLRPDTVLVLIEAPTALELELTNVQPGGWIDVVPGLLSAQVHYGSESPFGAERLVLTGFSTAFDRWLERHFTPAQRADPSITGPDADPDGNGLPNLVEFALGLSPGEPVSQPFPVFTVHSDGLTPPTVSIRHPVSLGHVEVHLRASEDLVLWRSHRLGGISTVFAVGPVTETDGIQSSHLRYLPLNLPLRAWYLQVTIQPLW